MQKAYITALYEIMKRDKRVCSLLSDSGTDYDRLMARDFPEQCFNFGISEQNKVGAASGMAAMGKIPFVYTTGAFLAYRAYEFIRDDICFQRRNVKLMGMGTGLSAWSTLGPSHHTTEDIAALRALPNLTLLSASTPRQLAQMVRAAYETEGPVYVRLDMSGEEELYGEDYAFRVGANDELVSGAEIAVFSTGTVLGEAYKAVTRLNASGYSAALADVSTLKPLDETGILALAEGKRAAFSVEEHSVTGGLGGAIAEAFSGVGCAVPLRRLGLDNRFASGYGKAAEIRAANALDADGIFRQIQEFLERGNQL